jgi:hypothetical protein
VFVRDLVGLIEWTEAGDAARVLVFTSADHDYLMCHVDVTRIKEYRDEAVKLVGEPSIAGLLGGRVIRTPGRSRHGVRLVTLSGR